MVDHVCSQDLGDLPVFHRGDVVYSQAKKFFFVRKKEDRAKTKLFLFVVLVIFLNS